MLNQNFISLADLTFIPTSSAIKNSIKNTKMESQNDFDKLLSSSTQTLQDNPIFIPLSDIVPNFSLAFGVELQNIQETKSLVSSHQCGFLESLLNGKESLDIKTLNPLSYPRSISVINELMQEKIEEIYATTQDPNDPKLHLLLIYKEQFTNLDTTMQTLKQDLTNKAGMLTSLLPTSMEQNPDLFLERSQEVWSSAKVFQESAREGLLWINAFFATFEETLSEREKNLIFNHVKTIQTHWKAQTGGEDGKIVLENGMIYQEYKDNETPNIYGFTLIAQNFVYAYREETLEDNTTQVVLQVYEKAINDNTASSVQTNIIHFSRQMQKSLDFNGQNLKLVGEIYRI